MPAKTSVLMVGALVLVGLAWFALKSSESSDPGQPLTLDLSSLSDADRANIEDAPFGPIDDSFVAEHRASTERSLLDAIRDQSDGRIDLSSVGRDRLAAMSDDEFIDHLADLAESLREVQHEDFASAERWLDAYRASWPRQDCPAGGSLDVALFDDLLANAIGLESFGAVEGFELNHVADVSLPAGVVHLSRSTFDDGWSVDLGVPGVHPLFAATVVLEDWELVGFAQLVVSPGVPARWVEEERFFLEAEYGSLWISSPDARVGAGFDLDDSIQLIAFDRYVDELIDQYQSPCEHWAHADGRNVVRQDASYDGAFPAYVAYDAAGELLAITWDFRPIFDEDEATPGVEQPTPTPAPPPSSGSPVDAEL